MRDFIKEFPWKKVLSAYLNPKELATLQIKSIDIKNSPVSPKNLASLINASGEVITLRLFEELSPGVKLIGLNNREAVFEKNQDSLLVINFKNQIIERKR